MEIDYLNSIRKQFEYFRFSPPNNLVAFGKANKAEEKPFQSQDTLLK